jgi:hypothetical protein
MSKSGEFFARLLKHILVKRDEEFPVLVEKFFSETPVTERERRMFDNGYMLGVNHVFRGLSDHVTGFDFKSMPPATTEAIPFVTEPPSPLKKVN